MLSLLLKSLLVSCFLALQTSAYSDFQIPKLSTLDFKQETHELNSGVTVVVTTDLLTNHRIYAWYSPLKILEQIELRSPGGQILEREEFFPGKRLFNDFKGKIIEIQKVQNKYAFIENGKRKSLNESAFFSWCEENPYDPDFFLKEEEWNRNRALNNILNGKKVIEFLLNPDNHEKIGMNTSVDSSCKNYPRGGLEGLASDMQSAVDTGLSCLGKSIPNLYKEKKEVLCKQKDEAAKKTCLENLHKNVVRLRYEAIRITMLFSHAATFKIDCLSWLSIKSAFLRPMGVVGALALVCQEHPNDPPGIDLFTSNLETIKDNPTESQAILFHELMHLVGQGAYAHHDPLDATKDIPYLVENCCFHNAACTMLLENKHQMP